MRTTRVLILVLALLALGLSACGGNGKDVPDGSVAVVGGEEITKAEFDELMERAKTSFAQNKQQFPKTGTPQYKTLQNQAVQYLVQQEKYRQKADDLDIEVTDKEVDDRLKQVKKQYFGGNESQFRKNLEQQGLTEQQVRGEIEYQLISEKIYEKVTEGVKVTDEEIADYYAKNKSQYRVKASRDVRHILVTSKPLATRLRTQLQNGGSWRALAKKHSKDPSSKDAAGKLTVRKGETVPPFDKVAFSLEKNKISAPVKTQFGWHIIQPVGDVKAPSVTPLKDVKEQIRQQLLQDKRRKAVADWSKDTNEEFEDEIAYQVGYAPPATTGTTAER